MNEKHENSISASINDAISLIGELLVVSTAFLFIFTILFAPIFGFYVRGNRIAHYGVGTSSNDPRVKRDMFFVWLVLWTICLLGWGIAVYLDTTAYQFN